MISTDRSTDRDVTPTALEQYRLRFPKTTASLDDRVLRARVREEVKRGKRLKISSALQKQVDAAHNGNPTSYISEDTDVLFDTWRPPDNPLPVFVVAKADGAVVTVFHPTLLRAHVARVLAVPFGPHTIQRYRERVDPDADALTIARCYQQATENLGPVANSDDEGIGMAVPGRDVVFVVCNNQVSTVLTRQMIHARSTAAPIQRLTHKLDLADLPIPPPVQPSILVPEITVADAVDAAREQGWRVEKEGQRWVFYPVNTAFKPLFLPARDFGDRRELLNRIKQLQRAGLEIHARPKSSKKRVEQKHVESKPEAATAAVAAPVESPAETIDEPSAGGKATPTSDAALPAAGDTASSVGAPSDVLEPEPAEDVPVSAPHTNGRAPLKLKIRTKNVADIAGPQILEAVRSMLEEIPADASCTLLLNGEPIPLKEIALSFEWEVTH